MPPKTINQMSGMPQMVAAFAGWMINITLIKITQTVQIGGLIAQTEEEISFKGTVQPLKAQEIALKPEGQRAWTWLQIHCFASALNLVPNDLVMYNGEKYKIMARKDYSLNNYIEYHLVKDYESAA